MDDLIVTDLAHQQRAATARPSQRVAVLILVSPALFLLHEVEEYFTMLPWIGSHGGFLPEFVRARVPDHPSFILQVGVFLFAAFLFVAIACVRSRAPGWPFMVYAMLVLARLENAIGHIAMAVIFRGYAFGVITAALIVGPVSIILLRRMVAEQLVRSASLIRLAWWGLWIQVFVLAGVFVVYYR